MERYNRRINLYISVLFSLLVMLIMTQKVYADDATISVSTTQAIQGEDVKVTINVSADEGIGECNFFLKYNPDIIEISEKQDDTGLMYNGGGGSIHVQYGVSNSKNVKITINFKAKAPGISEINYTTISEDSGVLSYESMEWMKVSYQNGSVTVKAPYVASTDNYLTSLKVEAVKSDGSTYTLDLSPKFSKDVTKYNAKAVEGVTKLVITADKSDSKATIKMAGRAMDPGDNTTTITVTAEDGSTRKYVIYTYVEKKPETTTPPPEPIVVQIDGTDAYIKDIDNSVNLPEGFEKINYQYKGEKIVAAKGLVKNLIIMNIAKSTDGAGQLYIYEESSDTFYPMSNLQLTQKLYTIVKEPADLIIPAGFTETTVTVDEQSFKGWSNSDTENIYLVYAMNWNGDKGLYYYDATEKQVIRYFDVTVEAGANAGTSVGIDDYNNLLSQNERLKDEINKLKADNNKDDSDSVTLYKYLALGCCVMAVIYLGIIIYIVVAKKNKHTEDADVNDDEDDSTENVEDSNEAIIEGEDESSESELTDEKTDTAKVDLGKRPKEEHVGEELSIEESLMKKTAEKTMMEETAEETRVEAIPTTAEETRVEAIPTTAEDTVVESTSEEAIIQETSIDDMMDFEDIITAETVAAMVDEEAKLNKKVEMAEELTPEITLVAEETVNAKKEKVENKSKNDGDKEIKADDKDSEKKKKVAEIMDDDDSSINTDDLDMVLDELFDDLFD